MSSEEMAAKRPKHAEGGDGSLAPVFAHLEEHQDEYVARLAECVAIAGVSCEAARRPEVVRTMEWAKAWCDRLHATSTELVDIGMQTMPDGSSLGLPPVLLAQFGNDPAKKTLVIYGHLDVQPAAVSDGWDTDPWVLTEVDGKLFGRGVYAPSRRNAPSKHNAPSKRNAPTWKRIAPSKRGAFAPFKYSQFPCPPSPNPCHPTNLKHHSCARFLTRHLCIAPPFHLR